MTQLITLHIATAVCSQFLAFFATIFSLLSFSKYKLLKKRNLSYFFFKTPSIETLDNYFTKCLWLGFVLLTFTLVSGVYLFLSLNEGTDDLYLKIIWAFLTWIWYVGALCLKFFFAGIRKLITQISLFISILLLIVYFFIIF